MKIIVIVPTYNEAQNIGILIDELRLRFLEIAHEMHILVVDDNSPDGTAKEVEKKQEKHSGLHLITGEKAGLGAAYIRGMSYALDELGADVVFEMDADFSHQPKDISPMIAAIEQGADFVIGSRYVRGGKIPEQWGIVRKMISRSGNLIARYLGGLYKIRDCTAGFRAIRSSVLRKIDLNNLGVQGYAFQIALLHKALLNRVTVQEIPVEFVDRIRGNSKLGLADIVEFIISAGKIRFYESTSFVKFMAVGATGLMMNLGSFRLLSSLGMSKYLVSPIATELAIVSNFLLNNYWTFRTRETGVGFSGRGLKFNLVSLIALALSYSVFLVLSKLYPQAQPWIHQVASIIPVATINYSLNSSWTFREIKNTPHLEKP